MRKVYGKGPYSQRKTPKMCAIPCTPMVFRPPNRRRHEPYADLDRFPVFYARGTSRTGTKRPLKVRLAKTVEPDGAVVGYADNNDGIPTPF